MAQKVVATKELRNGLARGTALTFPAYQLVGWPFHRVHSVLTIMGGKRALFKFISQQRIHFVSQMNPLISGKYWTDEPMRVCSEMPMREAVFQHNVVAIRLTCIC
jgi:hypothetical protein